jgi:hypothetical protein
MKKIRLITYIGVRDKYLLDFHNNGFVFEEVIDLTILSGGFQKFERCKWIKKIIIPNNFDDVFKIIKKNYCDITLVYLGRKNIDMSILNDILLISKQSGSTTIVVNNKKFIRFDETYDVLKMIIKELVSRLICKINYINKNNSIDYFIFNSYSANLNIFRKFISSTNLQCCFVDNKLKTNKIKLINDKKKVGIFLDSYLPFANYMEKRWGPMPSPKDYYDSVVYFLHEQKRIRNLDEIYIYLHPNSRGQERVFFQDFKILERNEYKLEELNFCKICWSPGSDAIITLSLNGMETIVLTTSNFPKTLFKYHLQKAKLLSLDCIDLASGNKHNYIHRKNKSNFLKKLFSLQFNNKKNDALVIIKRIIKGQI